MMVGKKENRKIRGKKWFLLSVLTITLLLTLTVSAKAGRKKGKTMDTIPMIINAMLYSDPANTSCLQVKGEVVDNPFWVAENQKLEMSLPPLWLALRSNILLYGNQKEIVAIDAGKGNMIWKEPIRIQFTFMCNQEGVLVHKYTKWRRYGSPEMVKHRASTAGNGFITCYHSDEMATWYGYYSLPVPVAQGQKLSLYYEFNRHLPGQESFDWSYLVEGTPLGSLCHFDKKHFYILMQNQIHHFPVDATSEEQVKKIDIPSIESFALDHKESLTLVVHEDGMPFLKQFTDEGEELWKVQLLGTSQSKQPPASSPQGTIYYGERNSILAVENGEEKWRLPLAKDPSYFYITVLSDNSLLVASGNRLLSISEEGKIINTVVVPFTMTCRPIMGYDGEVYVGGSEGIQCLK